MKKTNHGKTQEKPLVFVVGFVLFFLGIFSIILPGLATDYTSSNFIVRDPVITIEGGRSTSSNFTYFSSSGQLNSGTSTASNFSVYGGFLYFPDITDPTLTATAGNAQVSLAWTASVSNFGYSVASYEVGQGTSSGGPYSYTNVGSVLSTTASSLSNGTAYYFIIRTIDDIGEVIATSTEKTATPTAPQQQQQGGGGGGGGGGSVIVPTTATVNFSGRAYPQSTVTILKDAQNAGSTIAGVDANFEFSLTGLTAGNYNFSVYSEDKDGRRSGLLTFPVSVVKGTTTNVSGIFIAPTIDVDKEEVRRGENIAIFGQSVPQSDITISVNSEQEFFGKAISDKDGIYLYNFDTAVLEYGSHNARSKAAIANEVISGYSPSVNFKVGTKTVLKEQVEAGCGKADLNCDGRVNLVDFSIAAFWFKRALTGDIVQKEAQDLNNDGKIDLIDFSIMAYYWTG